MRIPLEQCVDFVFGDRFSHDFVESCFKEFFIADSFLSASQTYGVPPRPPAEVIYFLFNKIKFCC